VHDDDPQKNAATIDRGEEANLYPNINNPASERSDWLDKAENDVLAFKK